MMRPLPLIVLIALLAGPGLAAGPAKEKDAEEVDKTAEAEARLPNSMRRHGVIGHVPRWRGCRCSTPRCWNGCASGSSFCHRAQSSEAEARRRAGCFVTAKTL
ncbi:hypothetical protein [Sulfitobacter faviae]|uniref:hypothetical protein n=1 Tax=Sulfitobacter faviae TaxID=1775881 RepID=UPI002456E19F|nr:hypothetical protein [Sulfitobacter faviae]